MSKVVFQQADTSLQHQLALACSAVSILTPFAPLVEHLYDLFVSQYANEAVFSGSFRISAAVGHLLRTPVNKGRVKGHARLPPGSEFIRRPVGRPLTFSRKSHRLYMSGM